MTDRKTPSNGTHPPDQDKPDRLVELYRDATANDAGPDNAARDRVLAYAREQAAKRAASAVPLPASHKSGKAANDSHWLRHALGSIAAIGLVGWLTMQHLDQPSAPQFDSATPTVRSNSGVSAPVPPAIQSEAPVSSRKKETQETISAPEKPAQMRAAPARAPVQADQAAQQDAIPAPATTATTAASPAPAAARSESLSNGGAPAPAPAAEMNAAPPAPAPAPAAAATAPAAAAKATRQAPAAVGDSSKAKLGSSAEKDSEINELTQRLPICDAAMEPEALAEQSRRIKARTDAQSAGQPLLEPAPICRPARAEQGANQPQQ